VLKGWRKDRSVGKKRKKKKSKKGFFFFNRARPASTPKHIGPSRVTDRVCYERRAVALRILKPDKWEKATSFVGLTCGPSPTGIAGSTEEERP